MHHEVLLALSGHEGDIICEDATKTTFRVAPHVSFLPQPEVEVVNAIVPVGHKFRELTRFVDNTEMDGLAPVGAHLDDGDVAGAGGIDHASGVAGATLGGLAYRRALGVGVEAMLDEYRGALVATEEAMLEDRTLPLTFIRAAVRPYADVFPALVDVVREVQREQLKGGKILDCLDKHSQVGKPSVQKAIHRLMFHVLQVMYNQLMGWIVHGMLIDARGEFFIKPSDRFAGQGEPLPVSMIPVAMTRDSQFDGSVERVSSSDGDHIAESSRAEADWITRYTIALDVLPSRLMPLRVAEKVLFIGKAVQLLRSRGQVAKLGSGSRSTAFPHTEIEAFAEKLEELKSARTFHLLSFETALDRIRAVIERHLWNLVVVEARLPDHLRAARDYFLMARGELFQMFVESSRDMMRDAVKGHAEADINDGPFLGAAAASGADRDPLFSHFRLFLHQRQFVLRFEEGTQQVLVGSAALQPDEAKQARDTSHAGAAGGRGFGMRRSDAPDDVPNVLSLASSASRATSASSMWVTRSTRNQPGAVWFGRPLAVSEGWSTEFSVRLGISPPAAREDADASPCEIRPTTEPPPPPSAVRRGSFAFVLQNDSPGVIGIGREGHGGCDGIENGIAILFKYKLPSPTGDEARSDGGSVSSAAGSGMTGVIVYRGDVRLGTSMSMSSTCVAGTGVASGDWVRNRWEHSLRITVRYTKPSVPGPSSLGVLEVLEGHGESARRILGINIRLEHHVVLSGTSGRVWAGFTCAPVSTSELAPALTAWQFQCESQDDAGWQGLGLHYRVSWPLHLVFTQQAIAAYNSIFSFMMMVKRVGLSLQRSWGQLMGFKDVAARSALQPLFLFRSRMAFVVDILQSFLHVDVLESAHSELRQRVHESRDFDTVLRAHNDFLSRVTLQAFLRDRTRRASIQHILDDCMSFTHLVDRVVVDPIRKLPSEFPRLELIAKDFRYNTNYLFTLLRSRAGEAAGSLMLRMDFNGFFPKLAQASPSDPLSLGGLVSRPAGGSGGAAAWDRRMPPPAPAVRPNPSGARAASGAAAGSGDVPRARGPTPAGRATVSTRRSATRGPSSEYGSAFLSSLSTPSAASTPRTEPPASHRGASAGNTTRGSLIGTPDTKAPDFSDVYSP